MMPTLPPMPDRVPNDVLAREPAPPWQWWVLRAKPRQEKKLARWLGRAQTAYFLPMRRSVRNWRGRRIRSEEPLLSGYVFLCGGEREALGALASGAAVERLRVDNARALYLDLRKLDALCVLDREMRELPDLVEGREVELRGGPLKGMRGIVRDHGGSFVVRFEMLGRAIEVALDPAEVVAL
jgi:transcription antitermination factor NusG